MQPRGTVLVVDDDEDTRACVMTVLENEGYDVQGSSDGSDALRVLKGVFEPDLVLLDLMMPIMSGWELLDELAKIPRLAALPVIVFTAAGDPLPSPTKLKKPVVRKPIDVELLLSLVNEYCGVAAAGNEPPSDLLPKIAT